MQAAQAPLTHFCGAQSMPAVSSAHTRKPEQIFPTARLLAHVFCPGVLEQSVPTA
jgi:hypothetical protein